MVPDHGVRRFYPLLLCSCFLYRPSARELKTSYTPNRALYYRLGKYLGWILQRMAKVYLFLNAVLMSPSYSHFLESLLGLATIRAYGERYCADNKKVDTENSVTDY